MLLLDDSNRKQINEQAMLAGLYIAGRLTLMWNIDVNT